MSYPKFRIIDELLTDFWYKIGAQSYLGCVVPSQGSKLLSPRFNTKDYAIIVIATLLMSYPKFSIIDELLTEFWCKIGAQGYLGWMGPSQGSTPLLARCNSHSYPIIVSTTLLMSCPKFSIIDELLTDFWCKMITWGYLGWVVPSQCIKPLPTRCNAGSNPIFVNATFLIPCPKFSVIDEILIDFSYKRGTQGYLD